jgi:hypothetical protein
LPAAVDFFVGVNDDAKNIRVRAFSRKIGPHADIQAVTEKQVANVNFRLEAAWGDVGNKKFPRRVITRQIAAGSPLLASK